MLRAIKIVALALGFLWLAAPAAIAGDAVVASEAYVDVIGKDASDARSQAMAKGQVDALLDLLNKITPNGQGADIIATLDAKKIAALVRGTEVIDEKINDNRYRARLTVNFDADGVSMLISKFAAAESKEDAPVISGAFLMIPVYEEGGSTLLWEEENPWLGTWKTLAVELSAGDVVVPYGDKSDGNFIDTKSAGAVTYASLVPMTLRYGVTDILILQAKYTKTPDMVLTVVKRRLNRARNEVNMLTYRADPQETRDTLMARAARDIVDNMQTKKTEEVTTNRSIRGGDRNKIMLLAKISTTASWTDMRKRLADLPMIDKLELLALSPQQVDMIVHYRGSPESLVLALEAKKLRLVQHKDYWVVSRD